MSDAAKPPATEAPSSPAQQPTSDQKAPATTPAQQPASSSPAEPPQAAATSQSKQEQQPPSPSPSPPPASTPSQAENPPSPPAPSPPAPSPPAPAPASTPSPSTPTKPPAEAPQSPAQSPSPPSQPAPPAAAPPASSTPKETPDQPTSNSSGSAPPVVTVTPTNTPTNTATKVVTSTTTQLPGVPPPSPTSSSSTSTPTPIDPSTSGGSGLDQKSKVVAIGVVVPIAVIAILAIIGLFWWKKRRARQEAEEERRKEVEDYAYNPNADPTIPAVGLASDNSYEVREESSSGYRGWGSTTAAGSAGRKTSTTMSGGMAGNLSDPASPTRANASDVPLMDGSSSPDGEILGVMGPSVANNRGADVRRGPSNASSSYSATARSECSDGGMYGNGATYYEQYGQNPYNDQRPQELPGQAVIRDNPARRSARIENPSHFPQQSAGIAQNF